MKRYPRFCTEIDEIAQILEDLAHKVRDILHFGAKSSAKSGHPCHRVGLILHWTAGEPKWVCRPDGWDSDFEIYIPDENGFPGDLNRAIEALERRDEINSEGKSVGKGNIELAWIDPTSEPPSVAFPDTINVYVLWTGSLDDDWRIQNFTRGDW